MGGLLGVGRGEAKGMLPPHSIIIVGGCPPPPPPPSPLPTPLMSFSSYLTSGGHMMWY